MEQKPESFIRYGTKQKYIEVSADDILDAMADGKDISIEYAMISGKLDIKKIASMLRQDSNGKLVISGSLAILISDICEHTLLGGVSFSKDVNFQGTTFRKDGNFSDSIFAREANFNAATFQNMGFSATVFKGCVVLSSATFKCVFFDRAVFEKFVTFIGTTINEFASFNQTIFERGAYLEDFTDLPAKSFDSIGYAYRGSLISGAGYFFEKAGIGYQTEGQYSEAADSFRNAKVEYEKEGKYEKAGEMYVNEKESAKAYLKTQKRDLKQRVWLWIWKYSSNYGESPLRFIGCVTAIVFIFAIIYMPIMSNWFIWWPSIAFVKYPFHEWSDGIINGIAYNIVTALYFSVVTFATLGFGDIAPVSITGKVCAIVEVLLGYLMFGVLITLVARKVTRN